MPPPISAAFTGETLGSEIIKIHVGHKRVEFQAHKKLICETSEHFRKALTDPTHSKDGTIYLSHPSPETFSLFIGWLYRRQIPIESSQAHFVKLHHLYAFAERISQFDLCDRTIDAIRDILWSYDEATTTPALLRSVYESTILNSPLRQLCMQDFARDLSGDSGMAWMPSLKGLDVLYGVVRDNKEIFDDYFRHFSAFEGHALPSARSRTDFHYCDFHKHVKGEDCYVLDRGENGEAPEWKDGDEDDEDVSNDLGVLNS